jgi:hypothetical protein
MVWNADPAFGAHSLHDNKTELAVATSIGFMQFSA